MKKYEKLRESISIKISSNTSFRSHLYKADNIVCCVRFGRIN